jgi:hypothetical protein
MLYYYYKKEVAQHMSNLFRRADEWYIDKAERLAHRFQKRWGKNNFFLARICGVLSFVLEIIGLLVIAPVISAHLGWTAQYVRPALWGCYVINSMELFNLFANARNWEKSFEDNPQFHNPGKQNGRRFRARIVSCLTFIITVALFLLDVFGGGQDAIQLIPLALGLGFGAAAEVFVVCNPLPPARDTFLNSLVPDSA